MRTFLTVYARALGAIGFALLLASLLTDQRWRDTPLAIVVLFVVVVFLFGGLLKFLDGLAEPFGQTGELGAAEENKENDQNDHELGRAETKDSSEEGCGRCHSG